MAFENVKRGGIPGAVASGDLTGDQFKFVIIDGEKTVGLAGNGEAADGVLQNKPNTGQAASIAVPGDTTKVLTAAALAAGADASSDAAGLAVVSASGDYILGKVLTATSAGGGELATILLVTPGRTA